MSRISFLAASLLFVASAQVQAQTQQSAPAAPAAVAAAPVDTMKVVDEPLVLAGFYELGQGRGITVTLENDVLYGAPSTGEKRQLLHKYGTTYNVDGTQMLVTFTLDANGLPTEMIMRQNGQQRVLKKAAK